MWQGRVYWDLWWGPWGASEAGHGGAGEGAHRIGQVGGALAGPTPTPTCELSLIADLDDRPRFMLVGLDDRPRVAWPRSSDNRPRSAADALARMPLPRPNGTYWNI